MGIIFCSYIIDTKISRIRSAIINSELSEIKAQIKDSASTVNSINDLVDSEIDQLGNTPLLLSIEARQLTSFCFLLTEFTPNLNRGNYYTDFKPLHVLALTKVEGKSSSFRIGDSFKKYGIKTKI